MSIDDTLKERITQMSTDVQGGPSLQQAIQQGRARRRRRALAAVGSGVATACVIGVVAGAVFVGGDPGGDEQHETAPVTAPADVPRAIERAVREQLPANAEITSTEVKAFPGGSSHINPPELPRDKWDQAGSWIVQFELGSGEIIRAGLTDFAEQDIPDSEVRADCAKWDRCDYSELDDGTPVTTRMAEMFKFRDDAWVISSDLDVADPDAVWNRRALTVHLEGSYQVSVSDAVDEPVLEKAQSLWTLDAAAMRAIATDEDVLGGASHG